MNFAKPRASVKVVFGVSIQNVLYSGRRFLSLSASAITFRNKLRRHRCREVCNHQPEADKSLMVMLSTPRCGKSVWDRDRRRESEGALNFNKFVESWAWKLGVSRERIRERVKEGEKVLERSVGSEFANHNFILISRKTLSCYCNNESRRNIISQSWFSRTFLFPDRAEQPRQLVFFFCLRYTWHDISELKVRARIRDNRWTEIFHVNLFRRKKPPWTN